MKDFNNVDRYSQVYEEMDLYEDGAWVNYEDYKDLLDEYNELKYRLDSLDK